MPPRKRQRYRKPFQRTANARPDQRVSDQALDAAARNLCSSHSLAELRSLVQQSREAFQFADQLAQQDPSPQALRSYRSAERILAEVERALSLAESA